MKTKLKMYFNLGPETKNYIIIRLVYKKASKISFLQNMTSIAAINPFVLKLFIYFYFEKYGIKCKGMQKYIYLQKNRIV